ncbi:DUF3237 domain-containing protein [Novosphingobium sp.]|jgi:hypothetical protein|uniref:DUF3237 domain-containing protein n=1 Tax=Novosphingobium sp. TaxID=1874826 RepID=UPI001ED6D1B6|nr:DUF3237 domain-containing protein [Novosphingobium sp.]MBK6802237.1 DUF3237 domain-containing protein [Novosphingobium sp.]MBK9009708.1 DUF3237 domain-containing protein [Novosphingobium sp.]
MTPFGQPPAFRLEVEVLAPQALDPASMGPVRVVSITGGRVSGALEGRILPGGTDWQTVEPDGSVGIEARYLLELADGARIELQSRGRRAGGTGAFWSSIWLRSADPAHAWVNGAQFIGLGRKLDGHVAIDAFALPES